MEDRKTLLERVVEATEGTVSRVQHEVSQSSVMVATKEKATAARLYYVGVPIFPGQASGLRQLPQSSVDWNALQEGKVSGDKISFTTEGGNAKILFQGTAAGNEIKMTRTREGGQAREFTLKRAQ